MIEWAVTGSGLRVSGSDNSELQVTAPDIEVLGDGGEIPRPVDATVDCRAEELHFPMSIVYAASLTSDEQFELGSDGNPLRLPMGEYVVDIDAEVKVYLRAEGPIQLRIPQTYDEVVVTFPEKRRVTLGFRGRSEHPIGTVTVPERPEGIAAYLTHAAAALRTTGPERSYPSLRGHPPLVETGETAVPDPIREATPETGIELLVPEDTATLLVCAPLAYYLGAEVRTESRDAPLLRAPGAGVSETLPERPRLQTAAARLLRKVFFFDCLVRNAGPHATNLAELSILDAMGVGPEEFYDQSPADRLAAYLDVPYAAVEQRLPDWHLSTYVAPDPGRVDCLPFLLADLSLVYLPQTSELEGGELVERSLDDFYRGPGDVASVDVVKPELQAGRVHGWLADGVPIDVFKSTPQAYRNRLSYLERDGEDVSVTVVLNDEEMHAEHTDVESIYRARAEDISMSVHVEERLTQAELARTFEADNEFVHYIGHCETDGLRCPDGYLPATSIDECNAETFFLNACGSFHEGTTLVEKGSVAGAVTFSQVLNDQAVTVGSAFARLLVHGFCFERAMRLARRRIMMGKDYTVVGDGTHVLTQSTNRLPATARLEPVGDQYLLTYDQFSSRHTGGFYRPHVPGNDYSYLCGNESEFAISSAEARSFLDRADMPVIFDGEFHWSDDLVERIE